MMFARANCRELPLPAESVDMIFTDPPYLREYLPCYGWLAREAMRVLKPGGFVLAMAGGLYINQIFRMFDDAGLSFFWEYTVKSTDSPYIWPRWTVARGKAILAYSNGAGTPRIKSVLGLYDAQEGKDKLFHHWGQPVSVCRYYIDCFSAPGELVLDPFIGGGTTAVACELIGRRCLGFDLDPAALATTAARLAGADILHTMPLFQATPTASPSEL